MGAVVAATEDASRMLLVTASLGSAGQGRHESQPASERASEELGERRGEVGRAAAALFPVQDFYSGQSPGSCGAFPTQEFYSGQRPRRYFIRVKAAAASGPRRNPSLALAAVLLATPLPPSG
jgi:hypothetical protein